MLRRAYHIARHIYHTAGAGMRYERLVIAALGGAMGFSSATMYFTAFTMR